MAVNTMSQELARPRAAAETSLKPPRRASGNWWLYLILVALSILFMIPFAWLVLTSLKPENELFAGTLLPTRFTLDNYRDVLNNSPVLRWFGNTLLVSVLAVVSVVFSSALVAFGFSRVRFRGRSALFALVIATYMLPVGVTLIPTFLIWNQLGFVGTFVPLWAGNLFGSAFYIFMLRQFLLTIPQDLADAARVDGAGYLRIFRDIMLPLIQPALIAVAIFEFQAKWNDLLTPLIYLNRPAMYTMALGLTSFKSEFEMQWAVWMAASVIFTLPMILLFFMAQRFFVEGVALTGIKG
ncbi:MAG: carbohydrate ABC transporter permease [Chloroflexota bacterium]|nr:carbohydrate ABC transporter permease [Chloroflexota bacterium]